MSEMEASLIPPFQGSQLTGVSLPRALPWAEDITLYQS